MNEIFEYVTEGMKWLSIGGGAYFTTLVGLSGIPKLFSERIKSQEDLDRITSEEAEKLGIEEPVTPKFHNSWEENSKKLIDGTYVINIGGYSARRCTVRHELYHIHRGHLDFMARHESRLLRRLDYFFRQEPQAIAYEVFRLRF